MKIVENGGLKFLCESESEIEEWRAESLFTKEEGTVAWLNRTLAEGDVFYDVGANIGVYTLLAAQLVGVTGRVYAFEPHVANAASLLRNIAANKMTERVSVVTCALAGRAGIVPFHYSSLLPGSSGSQLGHTRSENGELFAPKATELKFAAMLDDFWAERPPCAIKIDVDGNELAVLGGMRGTLAHPSLRSVQVEVHPNDAAYIHSFFAGHWQFIERHDTANGKKAIAAGKDPKTVTHNAIFQRRAP